MHQIRLGYLHEPLHEASAAAVARVLEAHDLEVVLVPAAREGLEAALAADRIDLFASAWLPLADADLLASGRMRPIGVLYRPAFLWCLAGPGPASIAGLAGASWLDRRIVVPAGGALAALARQVVEAYRLDEAGYRIEPVADPRAAAWDEAPAPGTIVPLCRPHQLLHAPASGLRILEDPRGVLGAEGEARLLLRAVLRDSLDPDLLDELDELTLGNKVVSAMAHAMRTGGMSAADAADAWQRGKLTPRA